MRKLQKETNEEARRRGPQKSAPSPASSHKRTSARKAPTSPRPGVRETKADQILALMKQPSGATLKTIMAVTGWQAHSVRGFVSGQLVKKMGLRVKSSRRDGERTYVIKTLGSR